MDIYLRTRGDQIDQGYRWVHLAGNGALPLGGAEPLIAQKPEASRLIYAEDFALLIARAGDNLAIHITGLPVTAQSQRSRQNVQNVLTCVSPASDERMVRGIAVAALEGSLASLIDQHITMISSDPGFQVDAQGLRQTLGQLQATEGRLPRIIARIETNTDEARRHLRDELYTYRLPQQSLYPVVVTQYRPSALLTQAHVWRGLTSLRSASLSLLASNAPAYLPSITLRNKAGQALFLPDQFAGDLNLVMLGKHLHHGFQGQRWLDKVRPLLLQYKTPLYVMLLTVSPIDAALKSLLTQASLARQVIVIAQNQEAFLQALHLERMDTLTLLLVDRSGRIAWQAQGDSTDTQIAALQSRLKETSHGILYPYTG